jgi:hypothetical protein
VACVEKRLTRRRLSESCFGSDKGTFEIQIKTTNPVIVALIKSISGIRGTIGGFPGEGLTPVDVINFASAYGVWVKKQNKSALVVTGRDARPSGVWISELTIHALRALGIDVIDLGLSTTPTVEDCRDGGKGRWGYHLYSKP